MDLILSPLVRAAAVCEARRRSLPAPERAAVLLGRPEELSQSGLCIVYDGATLPVDKEARALLEAVAISAADLPGYVARRAADSDAALTIAWACAQARRGGVPLAALLPLLPAELPYEDALHLAALLRLEVVAQAGIAASDGEIQRKAFAETGPLLDSRATGPLASRLLRGLTSLAHQADEPLRLQIFSWSAACMLSAASSAAALLGSEPPIDALVDSILAGDDADSVNEGRAAPFQRLALHHAYLTGALLAHHPAWWPELYREILNAHGGDEFTPLPALLDGLAERPPGSGAPPLIVEALLELGCSRATLVRQSALATLAGWPELEPAAQEALATVVRDREPAVRAAVAAALAGTFHKTDALGPGLLRRLCDDPEPAVRAAAAWSTLSRHPQLSSDIGIGRDVLADLRWGSPGTRRAAALTAACLGSAAPELGELLVDGLADFVPEEGPEWRGLERFSSPVFALALWATAPANAARLYQGAVDDNRWLLGLGLILKCDFYAVPPAPPRLRESLRSRSLARLGAETEIERLSAAAVLARHEPPGSKLLDTLLGMGKPTPDMLQLLDVLSGELRVPSPRTLKPLLDWLKPGPQSEEPPDEAIDAVLSCLGAWAPPQDAEIAALLVTHAEQRDTGYMALAQLLSRKLA